MSLFDKLRREVNKVASGSVRSAIGRAVSDAIADAVDRDGDSGTDYSPSSCVSPAGGSFCPNCGAPLESGAAFCGSCGTRAPALAREAAAKAPRNRDYFAALIAEAFPELGVREYVSPAELGGGGKPYDFALYSAGRLAGVVMLTEHNHDRNAAFLSAKQTAASAGVPFINFYLHMPNERQYVISRIRSFI